MLARLLAVGVAWFAALVFLAAVIHSSASAPAWIAPSREGTTALARSLNQLRPVAEDERHTWAVTKATSALRELVVEVDALNPDEARAIAECLVSAVHGEYDEILVYVQGIDPASDPMIRRIEWTPTRGYLASAF